MTSLGVLILLLPLAGVLLSATLGPRLLKGATHWLVIIGVAGAAVCAFLLLSTIVGQEHESAKTLFDLTVYQWISTGAPEGTAAASQSWFEINFRIDPLSAAMLMMVTFIATFIIIYSREYMRHHDHPERGYERFFAFLGLFVFSMCVLVLSGNFLLLYLGWEAVGLCSYLLIGFYYQRPAAAAAAKKAFLVNRIGDFGFGLGVLLIYLKCGNLDYAYVLSEAGVQQLGDSAPVVGLLLFCGAVGKSAQIPLYVWLPDAMEGPSPVSALIHAATMVTAGVYMVARCGAIFATSHALMTFVACTGAATALFAATMALAQYDMKRILAYSTISQLGYMFLGVGVYAADAAIFHLITHAFFKALLFLGAGSVMHALGGVIDVRQFGGLRKLMPVTCWTFVIGSLALAGFPGLSGFWSKDLILHEALEVHPVLGWIGIITAALTAFYTFRMVFMAFWGERRVPQGAAVHESGSWILLPLVVLAIGAVLAGWVLHTPLPAFLESTFVPFEEGLGAVETHHVSKQAVALISGLLAVAGILLALVMYVYLPELPDAIRASRARIFTFLHNKYYVDEGYDALIVTPLRKLGDFFYAFDRYCIDGLVWLVTAVPKLFGIIMRGLQKGALQGYGVAMVTGFGVLLFVALWYGRTLAG